MKVLASCDPIYKEAHGKAFTNSCLAAGLDPLIHIVEDPTKNKTYYACNRFLIADQYIEPSGILITDIDCYFNKALPPISEDIGLFLREYESYPGMKVAAGILWLNNTKGGRKFIARVKELILSKNLAWYVDQVSLYQAYNELKEEISVFTFTNEHMDWEFNADSYMWTGKGPRKHKNITYLEQKKYYESLNT